MLASITAYCPYLRLTCSREIRAADGEELLIHISIDTVKLNGKFFKSCVKQERPVKKGNLIEKMYNVS